MRYPTQEEARENLNAFRALWRRAIAKAQEKPPEYWADQRRRWREEYRAELVAAKDRECAPAVDLRARLHGAGVEAQHLEGLRAGLDERPSFVAVRRWWTQRRVDSGTGRMVRRWPFLVLLGPTNLGKTQAAAWALREAARAVPWNEQPGGANAQRRPLLMLNGPDFSRLPLYGNHAYARVDAADDVLEEARRASLLVLDDLLRTTLSRPHMDALSALLMARHGERRATILTANMDSQALEERLDGGRGGEGEAGPLWRRLTQQGVVVTLRQRGAPLLLVGGEPRDWSAK